MSSLSQYPSTNIIDDILCKAENDAGFAWLAKENVLTYVRQNINIMKHLSWTGQGTSNRLISVDDIGVLPVVGALISYYRTPTPDRGGLALWIVQSGVTVRMLRRNDLDDTGLFVNSVTFQQTTGEPLKYVFESGFDALNFRYDALFLGGFQA